VRRLWAVVARRRARGRPLWAGLVVGEGPVPEGPRPRCAVRPAARGLGPSRRRRTSAVPGKWWLRGEWRRRPLARAWTPLSPGVGPRLVPRACTAGPCAPRPRARVPEAEPAARRRLAPARGRARRGGAPHVGPGRPPPEAEAREAPRATAGRRWASRRAASGCAGPSPRAWLLTRRKSHCLPRPEAASAEAPGTEAWEVGGY
jgi:hypothetical protein